MSQETPRGLLLKGGEEEIRDETVEMSSGMNKVVGAFGGRDDVWCESGGMAGGRQKTIERAGSMRRKKLPNFRIVLL